MKTTVFYIILCISLLYSCSKDKKVTQKLNGDWELTAFKISSDQGWTVFPGFIGDVTFSTSDERVYSSQLSYWVNGDTSIINWDGIYSVTNKGQNLSFFNQVGDSTYSYYRILTLTSTDLQLEETLSNGYVKLFQFRKKD